eukprot:SAG31_NODE_482_length_15056_cov_5.057364_5_plen_42_part_00
MLLLLLSALHVMCHIGTDTLSLLFLLLLSVCILCATSVRTR